MTWRRAGLVLLILIPVCLWLIQPGGEASPDAQTINLATELDFYEGLPHQHFESASLVAEKKAKPTVELHGISFYKQLLQFKPGDLERIKAILTGRSFYRPDPNVTKACGGFHPDYALSWKVDGKTYEALICLSCGDMWIYGPKGEMKFDIKSESKQELKELLKPYRRNRPA